MQYVPHNAAVVEEGEVEDGELPAPASAAPPPSQPVKTKMPPSNGYDHHYASSLGAPPLRQPAKMQIGISGNARAPGGRPLFRPNPLDSEALPKGPRSMHGGGPARSASFTSSSSSTAAGMAIKGAANTTTTTTAIPPSFSSEAPVLPSAQGTSAATLGSGLAIKGRSTGVDGRDVEPAPRPTSTLSSPHIPLPPKPTFSPHTSGSLSIRGAHGSALSSTSAPSKPRVSMNLPFKSKSSTTGPSTINMLGAANQSAYQAPTNAIGKGYGNSMIVPKAAPPAPSVPVAAEPGPSYTPPPRGSILPAKPDLSPRPPASPRPSSPSPPPPPPPPLPAASSNSPGWGDSSMPTDSHNKEKGKAREVEEAEEGEEGEELEEGEEGAARRSPANQGSSTMARSNADYDDSQNSRTSQNRHDKADCDNGDDDRRRASFGTSQGHRDRYDVDYRSPRSSRYYERDYDSSSRRHHDHSDDRRSSRRRDEDHYQSRHHAHSDDRYRHWDQDRHTDRRRQRDWDDDKQHDRHRHRYSQNNGNGNVWRRGSSYSPDADQSRREPDFHDEPGAPRHIARVSAQIKPSQPPTPATKDDRDADGHNRQAGKDESSRQHQPPQLPQASTPFFLPTPSPQPSEDASNGAEAISMSINDEVTSATDAAPDRHTHAVTFTLFGASPLSDYALEEKLGEGTFGVVHKARRKEGSVRTMSSEERERRHRKGQPVTDSNAGWGASKVQPGDVVALKKIVMHNDMDGVPITALREIRILKSLSHPNVVSVVDMAYQEGDYASTQRGAIYMVFPYMAHDLAGLLENKKIDRLEPSLLKLYAKQLLQGTSYLHRNRILHRDMKAANLLLSDDGVLQIADFGLARSIEDPGEGRKREYTNCVVTRWYRPPELLLGLRAYGTPIDMWGVGCVIGEMFFRHPVFTGSSDLDQLARIVQMCGTIDDNSMPGWEKLPDSSAITLQRTARNVKREFSRFSDELADLLDKLLVYDVETRLTADEALDHEWFWSEPLPAEVGSVKVFPSSHEYDKRKAQEEKQGQGGDKARAAQEAAFKGPNRPVRPAAAPVVQPLRQQLPPAQQAAQQGDAWGRPNMPAMQVQMQMQMPTQQMQQQALHLGMQAMPGPQIVRPAGLPPRPMVSMGGVAQPGPAFPHGTSMMSNGNGYMPPRAGPMPGGRMPHNGSLPERPPGRYAPPTKEMSIVGRSGNGWDQGDPASKRRKLSPPGRLSGGIAGRARGSGQVDSYVPFRHAGGRTGASAYDEDVPAGSAEPSE